MNLNRLIKKGYSLITTNVLIFEYWIKKDSAKAYLSNLCKEWLLYKLSKWRYLIKNTNISILQIANCVDTESYVSLYTAANLHWIVKQLNSDVVFSVTNNKSYQVNIEWVDYVYYNWFDKINDFWWNIDNNGIKIADPEKTLLDMLHCHVFNRNFKIQTEIETDILDKKKINQYLKYYPNRVKDFCESFG